MTDARPDAQARPDIRTVTLERDLPFPAEKLWRALTQPHLMEEWLMKNDFAPAVGHRFSLKGEWGGTLDCEVLTVEPMRRLAYTWNYEHADQAYHLESTVTFTLTPTATGTHLRMEQTGFRSDQKQALGGAVHGWNAMFGKLEEVLARLD